MTMPVVHDNEWLKIVASTCLGLIAGLIAEPLKNGMSSMRTRRQITKAIMTDLRFIRSLLPVFRLNTYGSEEIVILVELPAFEHYWSTNKGAFYESMLLRALRFRCEFVLSNVEQMRAGMCSKQEGLNAIEENITLALKSRDHRFYEWPIVKYRIWRSRRNTKNQTYVFLDNDGKPIPEGEGPKHHSVKKAPAK